MPDIFETHASGSGTDGLLLIRRVVGIQVEIVDLELSLRLGGLDARANQRIENLATHQFLRGLSQMQALDFARAVQWFEVGQSSDCSSESMLSTLALQQVRDDRLRALAIDVDRAFMLTLSRQLTELVVSSPSVKDGVLLGWRISLALEALRQEEAEARQR